MSCRLYAIRFTLSHPPRPLCQHCGPFHFHSVLLKEPALVVSTEIEFYSEFIKKHSFRYIYMFATEQNIPPQRKSLAKKNHQFHRLYNIHHIFSHAQILLRNGGRPSRMNKYSINTKIQNPTMEMLEKRKIELS